MSIYQLKPRFQALLRPLVGALFRLGVTANQVTLAACAVSVALGLVLYALPLPRAWFAAIPAWMLLRMAFNAIDGMLAREHGQRSRLGAYLNELTDVLSDAALYLPFAAVAPFQPLWIGAIALLAALGEMAGVMGQTVGASRRYDGPMGKSDRAFVFGLLGAAVAALPVLPAWLGWALPIVAALTAATVANRVRHGLQESTARSTDNRWEADHDTAHLQ
jgi:CDP-diacylglycerol--glycerol-3-phosphate 3-phosphatidyltransferase